MNELIYWRSFKMLKSKLKLKKTKEFPIRLKYLNQTYIEAQLQAKKKNPTLSERITIFKYSSVMAKESGPAVEWLINSFGLDLSLVSRLGGHSQPRTHRGKERFPGMTITYALMEKFEDICKSAP